MLYKNVMHAIRMPYSTVFSVKLGASCGGLSHIVKDMGHVRICSLVNVAQEMHHCLRRVMRLVLKQVIGNRRIQMSIGENHVVNKLEKNSKAMEGQRLARVIAKKNKEGLYESEHLRESKCISIPVVESIPASAIDSLMPHIVGMIANAQDEIIRELVAGGSSSINDAQIALSECIKYLDDSAKGNRITSEYMQKWFVDTYTEPAMQFVCELSKFDANDLSSAQVEMIEKKLNVLKDMFAGFASPKYSPDIPKCKAMIKFGEFLGGENWDDRMKNVQVKVAKIKQEKEAELSMDALGF